MRPIDADELKEYAIEGMEKYYPYGGSMECTAVDVDDIDNMPTLDAVPIVRCKNCIHAELYDSILIGKCLRCSIWERAGIDPEGFCYRGI